ncbi:MAG: hypothetical protein HYZ53_13515 [Planctomycetes bacterium]|nr:hypothetical protein [Planctomycetota bacterium]
MPSISARRLRQAGTSVSAAGALGLAAAFFLPVFGDCGVTESPFWAFRISLREAWQAEDWGWSWRVVGSGGEVLLPLGHAVRMLRWILPYLLSVLILARLAACSLAGGRALRICRVVVELDLLAFASLLLYAGHGVPGFPGDAAWPAWSHPLDLAQGVVLLAWLVVQRVRTRDARRSLLQAQGLAALVTLLWFELSEAPDVGPAQMLLRVLRLAIPGASPFPSAPVAILSSLALAIGAILEGLGGVSASEPHALGASSPDPGVAPAGPPASGASAPRDSA